MQRYWLRQGQAMANRGKTFAQIKTALPQLSGRSQRKLKRFMGIPLRTGSRVWASERAKVMRLFRACGHSVKEIADIYGVSIFTVYRFLKRGNY